MKQLIIAAALLTSANTFSNDQREIGHSRVLHISEENDNTVRDVNFFEHSQDDFNGDSIPDRLICNNTRIDDKPRINVEIRDGVDGRSFYKWNWTERDSSLRNGKDVITLTGCDIIYLSKGKPSIVLSTAYNRLIPKHGLRVIAPQIFIHNQSANNRFRLKPMIVRIPGRTEAYRVASRSVKCTQVPLKLKRQGVKDGAYCFYAGYDSPLSFGRGYGTASALAKFEEAPNGNLIVKDITQESGLPWKGGMRGTNMGQLRGAKMCSGRNITDGLHVMSGAFLDFDKDGLTDLVTVAQHASIRSHKMVLKSNKREKFMFVNSFIHDVNRGGMSEFLKVISFDENEKHAKSTCIYVSGEVDDQNDFCGSVHDHIRCYKDGAWITRFPEGERFSSVTTPTVIKANGNGRYVIKTNDVKRGRIQGQKYFNLKHAYNPDKIELSVSRPSYTSKNVIIKGWACVSNTQLQPRIIIRNKTNPRASDYKEYYRGVVDRDAGQYVQRVCQQKESTPLLFRAVIPKKSLKGKKGVFHIQADFNHKPRINIPHSRRQVPYNAR